jgi:ferredoxin
VTQDLAWLDDLERRADSAGLAVRGAFHPSPGEFEPLPAPAHQGTLVLLGFTADLQWPVFAASPEASDALPHPLDRWSRRVIGALAREVNASDIYPGDRPIVPFQQLAMRCESVHPTPIGLLIHPRWGLWHAYRGALIFSQRLPLPQVESSSSPCMSCEAKPCLHACPVGAFGTRGYDLAGCLRFASGAAGMECRDDGCRARRACPIGSRSGYTQEQRRFHMRAFLATFTNCEPD